MNNNNTCCSNNNKQQPLYSKQQQPQQKNIDLAHHSSFFLLLGRGFPPPPPAAQPYLCCLTLSLSSSVSNCQCCWHCLCRPCCFLFLSSSATKQIQVPKPKQHQNNSNNNDNNQSNKTKTKSTKNKQLDLQSQQPKTRSPPKNNLILSNMNNTYPQINMFYSMKRPTKMGLQKRHNIANNPGFCFFPYVLSFSTLGVCNPCWSSGTLIFIVFRALQIFSLVQKVWFYQSMKNTYLKEWMVTTHSLCLYYKRPLQNGPPKKTNSIAKIPDLVFVQCFSGLFWGFECEAQTHWSSETPIVGVSGS